MDKIINFGSRLKVIRNFLGFSRNEFAKKYDFPEVTLKYWELSKTKIRETQLEKLINAIAQEGLYCTKEWLKDGVGISPFQQIEPEISSVEHNPIDIEIKHFLKHNPKAIIQFINEEDIKPNPFFTKDDILGAIPINMQEIKPNSQMSVLAKFSEKKISGVYFLTSNSEGDIFLSQSVIFLQDTNFFKNPKNVKLFKVIWLRKT